MDPDREALRKAIAKWRSYPSMTCEEEGVLLAAAERDLARLEGEAPKKASLGELVEALSDQGSNVANEMSWRTALNEAAAVLRAVGEFAKEWDKCDGDEEAAGCGFKLRGRLP